MIGDAGELSEQKKLKIVGFLGLLLSCSYLALVSFLPTRRLKYTSEVVYALVIIALGATILSKFLKEMSWRGRKKGIKTISNFYEALLTSTILAIVCMNSAGVFGLLIYLLSGNRQLALLLGVVSLIGVIIYFPKQWEIEEKKREFPFIAAFIVAFIVLPYNA